MLKVRIEKDSFEVEYEQETYCGDGYIYLENQTLYFDPEEYSITVEEQPEEEQDNERN